MTTKLIGIDELLGVTDEPKKRAMNHNGEIFLGSHGEVDYYLAVCTRTYELTLRFEKDGTWHQVHMNKKTLRGLHHAYEIIYEFNRNY